MTWLKLLLVLSIPIMASCQQAPIREPLEQKLEREPPADTPEEILNRAAEVFADVPNLTDLQRKRLTSLYVKTYVDAQSIRSEIGKLKSLMFKEAAQRNFKSREMNELILRVLAADKKRLKIMFAALEELQTIIGYGNDKKEIYERLRDYDYPGSAHR